MSEYKHTVSKQPLSGFSADPEQTSSNAGNALLDSKLTTRNAITGAMAISYGKKLLTTAQTVAVDQIGNADLEVASMIGQKVFQYGTIAAVTGVAGVLIAGGVELGTTAITYAFDTHKINMQNEMLIIERGARRKQGVAYYD